MLRLLEQRPDMSQRELSEALGLSLGKTHYVLHSLLDRGLVKAGNFRRSGNKLAYAYVLTPTGLREKLRLTRAFLSRKEAEFEQLQHTIAALKSELVDTATMTACPSMNKNAHSAVTGQRDTVSELRAVLSALPTDRTGHAVWFCCARPRAAAKAMSTLRWLPAAHSALRRRSLSLKRWRNVPVDRSTWSICGQSAEPLLGQILRHGRRLLGSDSAYGD